MNATDKNGRGRLQRCGKCKGTGTGFLNHLNGETHCYSCNGTGQRRVYSAAEKAAIEVERAWWADAYHKSYDLRILVERTVRKHFVAQAGVDEADWRNHGELEKNILADARVAGHQQARLTTFWIREGLEDMETVYGS